MRFGRQLEGQLFLPEGSGRGGAVVILHERYGLVQHTLDLAAKLAGDGYAALAPDLFSRWPGNKEALRRGDVRAVLPDEEVASVVDSAIDLLKDHARIDPRRIAVMGVCQSGRYPIVVGSRRTDLAALVVFYGAAQESDWRVTTDQPAPMPDMIAALSAPGLYVFGEADHVISIDNVLRLKGTMEALHKSYRMKIYPEVPHGWLNDTMPGRYRPEQAEHAWQVLLGFLSDVFEGRWPASGRVEWQFESAFSQAYDFSNNVRLE